MVLDLLPGVIEKRLEPYMSAPPVPTRSPSMPQTQGEKQQDVQRQVYVEKTRRAAQRYGLDPERFVRQIATESDDFAPDVISGQRSSPAGAQGIAQFMPETAKGFGIDPLNPDEALDAAAKYMSQNRSLFGGDERAAAAGYNWGEGNVQKAKARYGDQWEQALPAETQTYLQRIFGDGADAFPAYDPNAAPIVSRVMNDPLSQHLSSGATSFDSPLHVGMSAPPVSSIPDATTANESLLAADEAARAGYTPDLGTTAPLTSRIGRPVGGFRATELAPDVGATTDSPLALAQRVSDTRVPILSPAAEALQGGVRTAARPIVRTALSALTGGPVADIATELGADNLPVVGGVLKTRADLLREASHVGSDLAGGFVPTTLGGFATAAVTGDAANAGEAATNLLKAGRGAAERVALSGLEGEASRAPEAAASAEARLAARGRVAPAGAAEEAVDAVPSTVAGDTQAINPASETPQSVTKPADIPLKERPGIKAALAAKEEATLPTSTKLGPEGSTRRKIVGALNPSADMPREVHVANQARVGVKATTKTEWSSIEAPAYRKLEATFEAENPPYIGPKDRPNAGTWTDYAEKPSFYEDSPKLEAAREELRAAQNQVIESAQKEYGVDIKPYQGEDPGSVYIPHAATKESVEQAAETTSQSLAKRSSVAKERAYDSISDRMARQPDFKPETDAATLADVHSSALASMAANNTFKAGVNGKTLTEVIDETHPGLRDARDKLAAKVQNVKNKIDLAERRAVENNSALAPILKEQAAVNERAVPRFVALTEADKMTPELKRMSTQLQELKVRATSIDKAVTRLNGRGAAVDLRLNDARSELGQLEPQLAQLRQRYHTAVPGDYVMNKSTFQYHPPKQSAAIDSVLKTGFNNAFIDGAIEAGNTTRAVGLGPDFSPLTIQGGLGAFSHPDVAITNAKGLVNAAFQSQESFAKSLDPAVVKRFEFANNRRLGSLSEEVVGDKGFSLPGQPVKKFNDALQRVVDYGTLKAWENDSALLMKMGEKSQNVADHEAANALSKIIPRINNAETGRSLQRVKAEGFLPTSRSFTAQPFAFAKDFASGLAKIPTGGELLGREKLALVRGSAMIGSMLTLSVGSALAFAEANGKNPTEAVKEVLDPSSAKFMHVILGNAGSIPIGGPFRSAFLGVFRTATQGPKGAVQYLRGRLQPEVGTAYDLTTNRDWKGEPIRTGSDWNQVLQAVTEFAKSANLLSGGTIQGYQDNGVQGAVEQGLSGGAGVNYTERSAGDQRDALAVQLTGKHYNALPPEDRKAFDARPDVMATREGVAQSKYKLASEAAHADTIAEVQRQETNFNAGKNDRKLSDVYRSESDANRATAKALEGQFASTFAGFDKGKYEKAVEGYYGTERKIPDGEVGAGGMDFDATTAAREDYLKTLPADQQEWVNQSLQVARENKTPLHQEYLKYIDDKKAAGYFDIDPADTKAAAKRAALDVAHPELDAAAWRFNSVGGKSGGALQTPAAVELALATPDAKNKEIKFAGLDRAINQSAGSLQMWQDSKKMVSWYVNDLPNGPDAEREARRLAASTGDKEYAKPIAEMDGKHRSVITGNLHDAASRDPELDAFLYEWGVKDKTNTTAAGAKAAEIFQKYKLEPIKAPKKAA